MNHAICCLIQSDSWCSRRCSDPRHSKLSLLQWKPLLSALIKHKSGWRGLQTSLSPFTFQICPQSKQDYRELLQWKLLFCHRIASAGNEVHQQKNLTSTITRRRTFPKLIQASPWLATQARDLLTKKRARDSYIITQARDLLTQLEPVTRCFNEPVSRPLDWSALKYVRGKKAFEYLLLALFPC